MLEVPLHRVDKIRQHAVGVAVDRVVDILLRNAVACGQALENFAQLGLRLAPVGVQLFQPVARIRSALEGGRCPSSHHRPLAVHLGHFLGQVPVLPPLCDGEHGDMMDGRFEVFEPAT